MCADRIYFHTLALPIIHTFIFNPQCGVSTTGPHSGKKHKLLSISSGTWRAGEQQTGTGLSHTTFPTAQKPVKSALPCSSEAVGLMATIILQRNYSG